MRRPKRPEAIRRRLLWLSGCRIFLWAVGAWGLFLDEVQCAIALGGLLMNEGPNLVAAVRLELLDKALASSEPEARAVAVVVVARTHQPQAEQVIEKALIDPSAKVRQAALRAALVVSPTKFKSHTTPFSTSARRGPGCAT